VKRRGAATLLVISMLGAACGGGSSNGVFESPGSQGSATSGSDTRTEPDAASTTTTTTTTTGSDDRLLVIEAGAAAAGFGEDPEGGDLIEALAASPTTQEAGLTRLVINYYDTDDEGAFALTMTLPMELLLGEVDEEVDISQFLDIQVVRVGDAG